ncbi:PREDICTED: bZIP transcription factor 17-like [Nelumbo nucifera]|uniref:BZIP transcription factor 17-like n=1 Tax=Nelumbo nucifera TaxID=4432 RepID=A0A1U7ZHU6_NELNU|nr:PREDICTED: bZIP transcription factor 17-like [Nelumbo nucifera]
MACLEPAPCGSLSETDPPNPYASSEFDSVPLPTFDPDFFSDDLTLPEDFLTDLGFDGDLDFLDDIVIPPSDEDFTLEDGSIALSLVSVDPVAVPSLSHESKADGSGVSSSSSPDSDDQSLDVARILSFPSPETGSCDREFCEPVSSADSAGCRSSVAGEKSLNALSPDSGSCNGDQSGCATSSPNSGDIRVDIFADQKIKLEEVGNVCLAKRKKDKDDGNSNPKSSKFRRSEDSKTPYVSNALSEEEEKRKARLMRNRESAQLSRQRKKHYVEELEDKVKSMHSTIAELNGKISFIMAENASLRQQLGGGAVCPPPPPGMYPHPAMAPVPYPWVPCSPYAVRPQGSQVPLVPIPKLRPQQPVSASKAKKSESKKAENKTKKVASVSLLGLLFFLFFFGGLVPFVNVRFGGSKETHPTGFDFSNNFQAHPRGRVLTVRGSANGSDNRVGVGLYDGKSAFDKVGDRNVNCKRGRAREAESEIKQNKWESQPLPGSGSSVHLGNASEPLVASLYVPRNDKLVKIDGNLIIHSVMASERAIESSRAATGTKSDKTSGPLVGESKETRLAIARSLAPALSLSNPGRHSDNDPRLYRSLSERQKALGSGPGDASKKNSKSATSDGSLQEWFREGLAGPILGTGMCTEVFQFNVSPDSANPGAIIPAASVANISEEQPPDSANHSKRKNRRILYPSPIPLSGSSVNQTEEHDRRPSKNESFQGNKSASSMVVSVLVDPREASDIEGDGVISSKKSLSRIFVVVLVDSVKYVTYSCVVPFKGSNSPLVTA